MKSLFLSALFYLLLVSSPQVSYGCSCVAAESTEQDPKIIKESVKKYFLNEFKGAVFTGKVLKIEKVEKKIDDDFTVSEQKISVKVEKYWLGVDRRVMTIYTGMGGGDCGVNFETGKRYFFYPQISQNRLETGICDYTSNVQMQADGASVRSFEKILGKAKTFKKNKR